MTQYSSIVSSAMIFLLYFACSVDIDVFLDIGELRCERVANNFGTNGSEFYDFSVPMGLDFEIFRYQWVCFSRFFGMNGVSFQDFLVPMGSVFKIFRYRYGTF